mmetsp:Transcript_12939/g.41331  ORF Transcript_12939/g.41331 Transcript_12939/m.41331 type:complete len:226 (-) Transcript_12939:1988-2665(-)
MTATRSRTRQPEVTRTNLHLALAGTRMLHTGPSPCLTVRPVWWRCRPRRDLTPCGLVVSHFQPCPSLLPALSGWPTQETQPRQAHFCIATGVAWTVPTTVARLPCPSMRGLLFRCRHISMAALRPTTTITTAAAVAATPRGKKITAPVALSCNFSSSPRATITLETAHLARFLPGTITLPTITQTWRSPSSITLRTRAARWMTPMTTRTWALLTTKSALTAPSLH